MTGRRRLTVSRNQLVAMNNWLETTESADDALAEELWRALQSGQARVSVSVKAVAEALYYAENAREGDSWSPADERAFNQLDGRLRAVRAGA